MPINNGQRRWPTGVNGRSLAVNDDGPPVNRHRTIGQPPVNSGLSVVNGVGLGQVKSGHGPCRVMDRVGDHVAPPEWATWHLRDNSHPRQTWGSNSRPQ
nr:hypothetical protein [Tanacetum cinerariifolium]